MLLDCTRFYLTRVPRVFYHRKRVALLVLGLICTFHVMRYYWWEMTENKPFLTRYAVDSAGCRIPVLDPLDPSVMGMVKRLGDLECKKKAPLVAVDGLHRLYLSHDRQIIQLYGKTKCYHQTISWENDNEYGTGKRVTLSNNLTVTSEFIVVQCLNDRKRKMFTDYFPFIQKKAEVEARVDKAKETWKATSNVERFSVVLLGLDSVSRNQFLRHMKKTHAYIKENLVYVDLKGYNKVGISTYPNMVAFLTGKEATSFVNTSVNPADSLPFIWKDFAKAGYRTLFSEDIPSISIFNCNRKGFGQPPTDYYLRPFSLAVEKSSVLRGKRGCNNQRPETEVVLKWTEDLLDEFPQDPVFALNFLTRLSHDYFNELSYQDKPVRDFFKRLNAKGHLANAIVFFFGDHGFRFGKVRSTYVGRMEDKLPLAFLILPNDFPRKHPQLFRNLKTNENRLTTPFDMFGTLSYILNFSGKTSIPNPDDHCVSLMSSEIPGNRTCEDAAVGHHFCACIHWEKIDINCREVRRGAELIVKAINNLLVTKIVTNSCAPLTLQSVKSARVQVLGIGEYGKKDKSSYFQITVQVEPSKGIFEGSVWFFEDKNSYTVDKTIERVNLYRDQSICVDENTLKPYCYCI